MRCQQRIFAWLFAICFLLTKKVLWQSLNLVYKILFMFPTAQQSGTEAKRQIPFEIEIDF